MHLFPGMGVYCREALPVLAIKTILVFPKKGETAPVSFLQRIEDDGTGRVHFWKPEKASLGLGSAWKLQPPGRF